MFITLFFHSGGAPSAPPRPPLAPPHSEGRGGGRRPPTSGTLVCTAKVLTLHVSDSHVSLQLSLTPDTSHVTSIKFKFSVVPLVCLGLVISSHWVINQTIDNPFVCRAIFNRYKKVPTEVLANLPTCQKKYFENSSGHT